MSAPPPDQFPLLSPAHLSIIPIARTSFIALIQRDSEADKKITAFLEAQQSEKDPARKKSIALPQFSPVGTAIQGARDASYVLLIKAGGDGDSPNSTELEIVKFINQHGRKVPRQ